MRPAQRIGTSRVAMLASVTASRAGFGLLPRGQVRALERRDGGPVQHLAVRRKLRAVARAVPALLGGIPVDVAAEMGADRRNQMQFAAVVAGGGDLAEPAADDAAFAGLELIDAVDLRRQQVFGEVLDR